MLLNCKNIETTSERFTNTNLKIFLYVLILIKITLWKFRTLNPKNSRVILQQKIYFMASFDGWGSTASRLEPLRGDSLLFTTKFPDIPGTHFTDLGRMKGWVDLGATQLVFFLKSRVLLTYSIVSVRWETKLQTLQVSNVRILKIKKIEFSGYYVYMATNI